MISHWWAYAFLSVLFGLLGLFLTIVVYPAFSIIVGGAIMLTFFFSVWAIISEVYKA